MARMQDRALRQRPFSHAAAPRVHRVRSPQVLRAVTPATSTPALKDAEAALLSALAGAKGRGKSGLSDEQQAQLNSAVEVLEAGVGVADPTTLPALDGKWRLLYTSRPGTSSPIQRTFVGVDSFSVFQEVDLTGQQPKVNNIVEFGTDVGYLKVEALASTSTRPLAGFTPRKGAGLPLFGKSFTNPPARPNMRVDFQFDQAAFYFKRLPFTLPYPVPFRYLGDETKGWIDVTYMNEEATFRLTRGNKGTLFVLQKDVASADAAAPASARLAADAPATTDSLLAAIEAGASDEFVLALIARMEGAAAPTPAPARSDSVSGTWRLVWSQQAANASPLQKWGTQQSKNYQVIDAQAGTLENVVDLGAVKVRAQATCQPAGDMRTDVAISGGILLIGGALRVPLPVKGTGYVDWLWLDERIRITRGSKGSLFVHVREPAGTVV